MKQARNYTDPYTQYSLKEHMALPTTTLATCWKLTSRPNSLGVIKTVAATSHTKDLTLAGHPNLTFLSAQGVVPSAVDTEAGLSSAGLEVDAVFVVDVLSEESVASGDWDSAYFEVFVVNYEVPEMGELIMFAGFIGDVKTYGERFRAEGRPLSSKAAQEIGNLYVPKCIARNLGDAKCKVATVNPAQPITNSPPAVAAGDGGVITVFGTVTGGGSNIEFTDTSQTFAHGYFNYGIIQFTSGVLAGRMSEVQNFIGTSSSITNHLVTDSTWKQSTTLSSGWQNLGFDDSGWSPAADEGAYGAYPSAIINGFPSDTTARWIWSINTFVPGSNVPGTVYFRKKFTPNVGSAVLTFTCDDNATVYLDGVEVGEVTHWQTAQTIQLTFTPNVEHVIAIRGTNIVYPGWNPGSLIVDMQFAPYVPVGIGGIFQLATPMPRLIEVGTTFKAVRGCDRSWETCKNVYGNLINFRGFPFVPGIEKAYRVRQQN